MQIKFTLTMNDAVINGQPFTLICIEWTQTVPAEHLLILSSEWLATSNYLTRRMIGLERVGESSLEIEPFEEHSSFF